MNGTIERLTSTPRPDALWATLHSVWITGAGIVLAFIVAAEAFKFPACQNGVVPAPGDLCGMSATSSLIAFWAYTKLTWFGFTLAQIIVPFLRGAYTQAKAPTRAAT